MSQDFSNKAAAVYTRLLTKYGSSGFIKLRSLSGSTFDQSAGTRTGTPVDTSVVGIVGPITRKLLEETRIRADQGVAFIDGAVEPKTSDKILIDDKAHTIEAEGITAYNIADVPVAYRIIYAK